MSGGYSPSILESARQASLVSRHVAAAFPEGPAKEASKLTVEEALFLGTLGGAKVVGLEDKIGRFEVGMDFDAQFVELATAGGGLRPGTNGVELFGGETWEEKIAKWVFCGDDRNTRVVWVKGRPVYQANPKET